MEDEGVGAGPPEAPVLSLVGYHAEFGRCWNSQGVRMGYLRAIISFNVVHLPWKWKKHVYDRIDIDYTIMWLSVIKITYDYFLSLFYSIRRPGFRERPNTQPDISVLTATLTLSSFCPTGWGIMHWRSLSVRPSVTCLTVAGEWKGIGSWKLTWRKLMIRLSCDPI